MKTKKITVYAQDIRVGDVIIADSSLKVTSVNIEMFVVAFEIDGYSDVYRIPKRIQVEILRPIPYGEMWIDRGNIHIGKSYVGDVFDNDIGKELEKRWNAYVEKEEEKS